jgi:hypothetical protein
MTSGRLELTRTIEAWVCLFLVLSLLLALPRTAAADKGGVTSADEIRALDGQIAAALSPELGRHLRVGRR